MNSRSPLLRDSRGNLKGFSLPFTSRVTLVALFETMIASIVFPLVLVKVRYPAPWSAVIPAVPARKAPTRANPIFVSLRVCFI